MLLVNARAAEADRNLDMLMAIPSAAQALYPDECQLVKT
jgi:hypothetical protein